MADKTSMTNQASSDIALQLFVRSQAGTASRALQNGTITQLRRLEEEGQIEQYDVFVWGSEICPEPHDRRTDCFSKTCERLTEFENWARGADVSLESTFRHRDVQSEFTGERYTVVSTPVLCLAVYEGADLTGVYPCESDGRHWTVTDYLDRLIGDELVIESTERIEG